MMTRFFPRKKLDTSRNRAFPYSRWPRFAKAFGCTEMKWNSFRGGSIRPLIVLLVLFGLAEFLTSVTSSRASGANTAIAQEMAAPAVPETAESQRADTSETPDDSEDFSFPLSSYLTAGIARVSRLLRNEPEWLPPPNPPRSISDASVNAETVLQAMAQSNESVVRERALEGLKTASVLGLEDHYKKALSDFDPEVRHKAFKEMAANAPDQLVEYVLATLAEGTPETVAGVDMALPELRAALEQPLLETFDNPETEPLRRRAAAYALGRMGAADAASALAKAVWENDPEMAYTCAQALFAVRDANTAEDWSKLLEHPEPVIRGIAADALADIGGKTAHDAVVAVLMGERAVEPSLQIYMVRAIFTWPTSELYPLLVETMRRNAALRPVAAAALRAKTKQDFGEDPEKWQQWIDQPPPEPEPEPAAQPDPENGMDTFDPTSPQPKAPPIYHEPVIRKRRI